ncbi:hypothetical protein [Flavobacterium sp.]|uniref:hypothetical protein n=1 Tax=Flavobacterium sp. TaxID=239 RepID=UPI003F6A12FD
MKNKIINSIKKNKIGLIFVGIVFSAIFPFIINAKIKFNNIEKNGKVGVGKFVEFKRYPKSRDYTFEYHKSNKKLKDLLNEAPDGFSKKIGRFFEIKYLDEYEDIIVDFNKEITDTTLILNAGFSREDIENMPK